MNKSIPSILVMLVLCCCGSKEFENEEVLWSFIKNPDYGYLQEKSVNGVDFSLLFKPTDLLVAQEIRNKDATPKEIDSLRNKYGQYVYFNLSMSRGNQELLNSVAGDRDKFGSMINTLSFRMQDKIELYSNKKDTVPLVDYIYPRMYGTNKKTSILLVYFNDDIKRYQELNMIIKDLGFGTGDISFKYHNSIFKNSPQINF